MNLVLEKLYNNELSVEEDCRPQNPRYNECCKIFDDTRGESEKTLRPEQLVLLEKMINQSIGFNHIYSQEMFVTGFKLGIQILMECFTN